MINSSVKTQVTVFQYRGSVMVRMIVKMAPMNRTALSNVRVVYFYSS